MNILHNIKTNGGFLSATERKISDYIMLDPQRCVSMSLAVFSKNADVSEGSVINFAKTFGMGGFTDLKIEIAQALGTFNNTPHNNVTAGDSVIDVLKKDLDAVAASFTATVRQNSPECFQRFADAVLGVSGIVAAYGVATSATVARDVFYQLTEIGIPAVSVTDKYLCRFSAEKLPSGSVAIAISASGTTEEIVEAMKLAKESGAVTLSLTSNAKSPLYRLCDVPLIVSAGNTGFDNFTTSTRQTELFVLDSIYSYIKYKKGIGVIR